MQKTQDNCSEEENDPFANDPYNLGVLRAEIELKPSHIVREFTITTDSYLSMCSSVYKMICLRGYGQTISESVFQYYAVSNLWQRLQEVGYRNTPGALELQCSCIRETNCMPNPLDIYLEGIGNYVGPDFCNRQFGMPTCPSDERFGLVTGTFGPVNANNHYFYEAYPAPGIAVLRILADLKYTANPCQDNLIWDLPPDLRPKENCKGVSPKPTRNLLGWAPAQSLTQLQLKFLEKCQITSNNFPTGCKLHCQNESVLSEVYKNFLECSLRSFYGMNNYRMNNYGINIYGMSHYEGSIVQGINLERSPIDLPCNRNTMYCEGRMSVSSYHKFNKKLLTGALISGYRMSKEQMYDKHCWSCYDFNDYKDVPTSWIETRNKIYEWGSVGMLNEPLFTTIPINKRIEQNLHIQKVLLSLSDNSSVYD